jgi:hypothetical protein
MAGSLRWFRYVADDGVPYAVFRDESNTEIVNLVADTSAVIPTAVLPKNLIPRSIRYATPNGQATRDITVLTLARFTAINGVTAITAGDGDIDSGFTFTVRSKKGEQITRIPTTADSGKDDGDNP